MLLGRAVVLGRAVRLGPAVRLATDAIRGGIARIVPAGRSPAWRRSWWRSSRLAS
jgi:hypothetical protein